MRRRVERFGRGLAAAAWLALAAAGAARAQVEGAGEDPLAGFEASADGVGWQGVRIGMSLVQAERRFGVALALEGHPNARCGRFAAGAERGGLNLTVGFPVAKPSAKIETLFVQFEGYQVAARLSDLVASFKRKAPTARYLADESSPERPEAEDPAPKYELPGGGGEPVIVHLRPRDGLVIARAGCLR
jgi:hypothetical protein